MKVFVTVGNTPYNTLIQALDELVDPKKYDLTIQIANGDYIPKNHHFIHFTDNIEHYYQEAEVVVSHAGAGSTFQLLEMRKKLVVVPNFDRVDDHQLDLADFVAKNNYACVCYELSKIDECLKDVMAKRYDDYTHHKFSGFADIHQQINMNRSFSGNNIVANISVDVFSDLQATVSHIIKDDGTVFSGSAIAINPEKIIRAIDDKEVADVLLNADIRYADGIGIVKTLMRKTGKNINRIPGCELWEMLMKKAGEKHVPVYLIGGSQEVVDSTQKKLKDSFNTPICGYRNGYFSVEEESEIIEAICTAKPKIIAVALGSPKQEMFIDKCKAAYPEAYYMGVGGSFDVFVNRVKRAPEFFRNLNLEWFYRALKQPKRLLRQTNLLRYLYLELARKL